MSGHSKWSQIKRQKAITDAKKGKVFSKFARALTIAAKEGGPQEVNFKLRLLVDRAKAAGMPNDNIERAVARGLGKDKGAELATVLYEGLGPSGSAFLIETATDNTNRTLGEVKLALNRNHGQLADQGSVAWMFDQQGLIMVRCQAEQKDSLMLAAIDAGSTDVREVDEGLEIYTEPKELMRVKDALAGARADIEAVEIIWRPKQLVELEDSAAVERLLEALDDLDDVVNVYSNV